MIKIFIAQPLSVGKLFKIDGANHHHLVVIRIRKGDTILVGDNNFNEFIAEVIKVEKRSYELKVEKKYSSLKTPARDVHMYISIPKKRKFEDIIYKCTQLGVNRFVPVLSARTEKRIQRGKDFIKRGRTLRSVKKNDKGLSFFLPMRERTQTGSGANRWKKKVRYGSELSARQSIPKIDFVMSFNEALKDFSFGKFNSGIFFWEEAGIENYVKNEDISKKIALFIGPEGGFESNEAAQAKESGLRIRSLGKLVMDVETASISAAALMLCTPTKI